MITAATARAYVALGSNLGDRIETLRSATRALAQGDIPQTWLTRASSIYETRPIGPSTEPFVNAVVEVHTMLPPAQLLRALLGIEAAHGRVRDEPWQARTLDLDIVVWIVADDGNARSLVLDSEDLVLPHPRARERDFVLQPLAELIPDTAVFGVASAADALAAVPAADRTILHRLPHDLQRAVPHD